MNSDIQICLRNCLITVHSRTEESMDEILKCFACFFHWLYYCDCIPDFLTHPLGGCHTAANTQIMLPICGRTARHNYLSLCYEHSTWRNLTKITTILCLGDPRQSCTGQDRTRASALKAFKAPAPPSLFTDWHFRTQLAIAHTAPAADFILHHWKDWERRNEQLEPFASCAMKKLAIAFI